MAFPTTGIIDNFAADDIANYSTWWGDGACTISGGTLHGITGGYTGMYRNTSTYGPDTEIYHTVTAVGDAGGGDSYSLAVRMDTPASPNSYMVQIGRDSGDATIYEQSGGGLTALGASVDFGVAVANGDSFGLEIIGTTIKFYVMRSGAGAWTEWISRSDATLANAGYIAFELAGNTVAAQIDDLGGGTVGGGDETRLVTRKTLLGVGI